MVSLALGIGANTAIFSLMDAVMWRLLPVEQPKALWAVVNGYRYQEYQALAATDDVLAGVAAPLNVSVDGSLEPTVAGQLVTGGYFGLLGVDVGQEVGCRDCCTASRSSIGRRSSWRPWYWWQWRLRPPISRRVGPVESIRSWRCGPSERAAARHSQVLRRSYLRATLEPLS